MSTGYAFKPEVYRFAPINGDSIVIPNSPADLIVILAPEENIESLVITWPENPFDGQMIRFLSTKNIALLINLGATLNKNMISIQATQEIGFVYDETAAMYMKSSETTSPVVTIPYTGKLTDGGNGDCVFYPTDTGMVDGNPLFASIQYVECLIEVANPDMAASKPVVSEDRKTITTNVKERTFTSVVPPLLGISLIASQSLSNAPDGVALSFLVHGVLAA